MLDKLIVCYDTLPRGVHMDDGKLKQVKAFHKGASKYMQVISGKLSDVQKYEHEKPGYFVWNYNNTRRILDSKQISLKRRFFLDSDILVSYPEDGYSNLASDKKYVRVLNRHFDDRKVNYFLDNVSFDQSRWDKIAQDKGITLKEDYTLDGDSIIVFLNRGKSGYTGGNMDPSEFAIMMISWIRENSKRPIIIRFHPYGKNKKQIQDSVKKYPQLTMGQVKAVLDYCKSNNIKDVTVQHKYKDGHWTNLLEEVSKCYACVTYGSSSAAPAIIEGKPLFVIGEGCFLHDMSVGDLSSIENVTITNDYHEKRKNFLTKYIHTHYTTEELRQGLYWEKIYAI